MERKKFSWKKRAESFRYAFAGIYRLVKLEHNAWIHCAAAIIAVAAGALLGLTVAEWIAVVLCIGIVLAAEAFNSAIEVLSNRVSPGYDDAVKHAKDLAAGAVLLVAVAAAITGLIIFVPKLIGLFAV